MGNNKKSIFLIDFDITISKKDSTDVLLETHQPEFKQELRKRYRAGEYSIREFIKYGLGSLNITKEQYIQTLQENVTIDETFVDFVKSGAEFKIVSAGARLNVQGTLSKYGINLPDSEVISNDLKFSGTDKNQITVENPFLDKEGYYGVDKKEAVENYKKQGYTTYFVGDGPSDYKALEVADFAFVRKGTRAVKFCEENGIEFFKFGDFDEILEWVENNKKF
ncbi:HAD-IB family phosphatase [Leptotrichia sp. oral taxon 879]|uniref:HAD-IB family phosphatase n=1 Tax=Leptotrichia sp. oral taxon 879 TaxID=1227267 RepID=UPI0003AE04C8|nr:HAD-IB family phosphatase [Leptotrichia sp. oral taxon 879]ERK48902.1 HAD phosphoserine phosphatase-like hydrolase, family IB [Leptotrichia sp. oral taxon 879 str. F0557]